MKESVIIGGENYGQGSSREHAALVPMYLGVRAVIAKSFARIHVANLINAGIIPLTFENAEDYEKLNTYDTIEIENIFEGLENGKLAISVNESLEKITLIADFTERQRAILKAGGLLAYTKAGE